MALQISTFSSDSGGKSLFKALGHPRVTPSARLLVDDLAKRGRIAIYDPDQTIGDFGQLYDPTSWQVSESYVQRLEEVGRTILGCGSRPVSELCDTQADVLFVASFESERFEAIRHLIPASLPIVGLDSVRLPDTMLSHPNRYLDALNFATNFAFFRDADGHHTQLRTANYWHRYGARGVELWLCLMGEDGEELAHWTQPLPDSQSSVVIDSAEVRRRFELDAFTGSLFLHALHAAGHEVVKYSLNTYDDSGQTLSCTHDANAWPADRYAGLPAPRENERVLLWVQNSHPAPIRAGVVAIAEMGSDSIARFDEEIPAFGTRAIDVAALLPKSRWPAQLEISAGRHFVRPRYEVVGDSGVRRIAHANVERTDLRPDPQIRELGSMLGKGFILPAPILPVADWHTIALPTPMATGQHELPVRITLYDATGAETFQRRLGALPRRHATALDVSALLEQGCATLDSGYGHLELSYDFSDGVDVDGWLHGLFRYERRQTGYGADTSFGAHLYNLPVTLGSEPQSYSGVPPGLSTRLFLGLGFEGRQTFCHLIYPASGIWHEASDTRLLLYGAAGDKIAERVVHIPRNGSLLWRYEETFDADERARASETGYLIVRDATCRLFGFHGLIGSKGSFSLDHMFGF